MTTKKIKTSKTAELAIDSVPTVRPTAPATKQLGEITVSARGRKTFDYAAFADTLSEEHWSLMGSPVKSKQKASNVRKAFADAGITGVMVATDETEIPGFFAVYCRRA